MDSAKLVKKLIKGWCTLEQLKCKHSEVLALKNLGFRINIRKINGMKHYSIPVEGENPSMFVSGKSRSSKTVRYLELSDIHAGSYQFDKEGLYQILERARKLGIEDVHISGDLTDGAGIYPGHAQNLVAHTADLQAELLSEVFLDFPEFRWVAISGNHDFSFVKQGSPNPISLIEAEVPNFHFLNAFAADLIICGVVKRLVHPMSSRTYAKSYPGQTYIRNVFDASGEHVWIRGRKFRMRFIQMGHYHFYMAYEAAGIWVTHPGGWQHPNEYTTRKGLVGATGAVLTEATICSGQVIDFKFTFMKPKR